jgi:hypothetical protein
VHREPRAAASPDQKDPQAHPVAQDNQVPPEDPDNPAEWDHQDPVDLPDRYFLRILIPCFIIYKYVTGLARHPWPTRWTRTARRTRRTGSRRCLLSLPASYRRYQRWPEGWWIQASQGCSPQGSLRISQRTTTHQKRERIKKKKCFTQRKTIKFSETETLSQSLGKVISFSLMLFVTYPAYYSCVGPKNVGKNV